MGQILVFTSQENAENSDIWVATIGDPESARPLLDSPHRERAPQISPDGRLLAWVSEESGESQVYLARLEPDGSLQPPRWQVSSKGGISARWSRNGRRLFYGTGFVMTQVGGSGGGSREIVVVENWASGFLDRRVE